jgi:serine/threonine protein kinase
MQHTDESQPGLLSEGALAPEDTLPARIAERFTVRRFLGRGASGAVYEVWDEQLGTTLALKALRTQDPASLFRFKSEFRTLANLSHPHLLQLYDLLAYGDEWLLTMELIEGSDFLSFVRPELEGPRPETASDFDRHPPGVSQSTLSSSAVRGPLTAPTCVERTRAQAQRRDGGGRPMSSVMRVPHARQRTSAPGRVLDEERLRRSLGQIATGLHALHRGARLHRDLKPANVLVSNSDQRVVICDFGLTLLAARPLGVSPDAGEPWDLRFEGRHGEVAGTLVFMSPEQARADSLSPASDWYSVGVMLYQALAGRLPYDPNLSYAAALKAKLEVTPLDPSRWSPSVPADLAQLALALLQPAPHRRAGYAEVMAASRDVAAPRTPATAKHADSAHRMFVGREQLMSQLAGAFARSYNGVPTLCLVEGRSGMGKSSLVEQFLEHIEQTTQALVLRGRCYEREELAYKALDPLVDALSSHLLRLDRAELHELLPASIGYLADLFPALRRVPLLTELAKDLAIVQVPHERRRLASRAFRELCKQLTRTRPLLLFIDDLQWGDADSGAILQELLTPPGAPSLMIVCAVRSEDTRNSPMLAQLREVHAHDDHALRVLELTVGPLARHEAERLALSLLHGESGAEHASVLIAQEAEGSPYFVQELAAHVSAHGEFTGQVIRLEELIHDKLAALPDATRRLLSVIALAAEPIDRAIVRAASGLGAETCRALRTLEAQRLILTERTGAEERIECYHDRVREAATQRLSSAESMELHRALALALESEPMPNCAALLKHWRGAGERERERHYALLGAERAEQALAFTRAAELYREAIALLEPGDPSGRRLRERLGHALLLAGRGIEAASTFLGLVHGAPAAEALKFRMLGTTQLLRGGRLHEGFEELKRADDLFGVRFPQSEAGAITMLVTRRMRIRTSQHKLTPHGVERRDDERDARLDALWEVAAAVSSADLLRGSVYSSELLLRAIDLGSPSHIAGACGFEAVNAATTFDHVRCQEMLDLAEAAGRTTERPELTARVRGMEAVCRQLQGRWFDATRCAREAQALLLGGAHTTWDYAILIWWEMLSLSQIGRVGELAARVPEALRDADARGDVYAATAFRTHRACWAWLALGRPDIAEAEVDTAERSWTAKGYQFQHWHMTHARCDIDLFRGASATRSLDRLMLEWRRSYRLQKIAPVRADMLYARARLALAAAAQDYRPHLHKLALVDAQSLIALRQPWTIALGRLVQAASSSFSQPAETQARLRAVEPLFLACGMRMHAAAVRVARGLVTGGAAGQTLCDSALAEARGLGAQRPEGFVRMLCPINLR